jgi:tRNA-2-methylthio-N6-dimethylallyladenosine synthase
MNERDSDAVAAQLVAKGYSMASDPLKADVVLLNTCSVRDAAEQKAIGKMSHVASQLRSRKKNAVLGFMGCMAQSRGKELIDKLPDVDLVIGTQKFHHTVDHIGEVLSGKTNKVVDVEEEEGSEAAVREHLLDGASGAKSITSFVSIMQGCNQFCTFCIVPYTRGRERSRSIEDIVGECKNLVDHGVREVTLLGQIVTSYGRREIGIKDGKSAFVQLIEAVHQIDGIDRIRFTSPHPKGYGEDLVQAYGRLPKLCESAHIPVQSGSNSMLKRMHRGYTRERFLDIIHKLREVRPDIGITTDIIVGFPGESEEEFEATLSLYREVEFDNAFVFKYSTRRNTPAAELEQQLPTELIEERHAKLLSEVNQIGASRYETYIGKTMQVLVEGPSRRNKERMEGRTRCNRIVVFDGSERFRGQLVDLNIIRSGSFTLYGDPVILK